MHKAFFRIAFIFLTIFCLLSAMQLKAQQSRYKFSKLTTDDGLSSNQIRSIFKDSRGFIWVATLSGLNRFDGFNVKIFKREPFDTASLIDNSVNSLFEDLDGNIWINTTLGFCIFDPVYETFYRSKAFRYKDIQFNLADITNIKSDKSGNVWYFTRDNRLIRENRENRTLLQLKANKDDPNSIETSAVNDIEQDSNGFYWFVHTNGVLEKIDPRGFKVVKRMVVRKTEAGELVYMNIFCDRDNDLWIFDYSVPTPLIHYKQNPDAINLINDKSVGLKLNSELITSIIEDDYGNIWVGTDHGGINIIDKQKKHVTYVTYQRNNEKSLNQNSITSLYKDNEGIIWVGTYKQGLNYYHDKMFIFNSYSNDILNPKSLQYNDVNSFTEDESGNILIGTNGGGLNFFNRQSNTFDVYRNIPGNNSSLSNDVIVSLLTDSYNSIWIGTYHGGLNRFDGKKFIRYMNEADNPRSLPDNRVWGIFEDSRKNLWIGTLGGGLALFDRKHDMFVRYSGNDNFSVSSNYIIGIQEDTNGDLWVGTSDGLFVMKWTKGEVVHYTHSERDPRTLTNNQIVCLLRDSRGLIWAGTREGLNLFNPDSNSFYKFRIENGLPDNTILSILEDSEGHIWLATTLGISRLTVELDAHSQLTDFHIINFDKDNGIINQNFNERSAYKTRKGELIFGGTNGFYIFEPSNPGDTRSNPPIYIVNFELHGEELPLHQKNKKMPVLNKSILFTDEIELKYNDNIFSVEFCALAYLNAERIKYRYKLEGFNDNWFVTDYNDRKVTFTNLDPGRYTFTVQSYIEGNNQVYNETQLALIIKPPFWKSKFAIFLYTILVGGMLIIFRQVLLMKERLKFQNEQARQETIRQQELNAIKTRFFTNVSHEFRTPLTLIITPLERLMKKYSEREIGSELNIIYLNAKRLLGLINQLLDFRKMEEQRLTLNPDYGNIIRFLGEVYKSYIDLAHTKEIEYQFKPFAEAFFMRFDEDKLEKIVFNLLSNAFKYTNKKGQITIETELLPSDNPQNPLLSAHDAFVIRVKDTGIGIPPEKHAKVFERFFQNEQPTGLISKGSGIGLSLTQEYIKLHNGIITLESEVDKGSTFSVFIPADTERIEENIKQQLAVSNELLEHPTEEHIHENHETLILLVEDNEDFRFYLRDNLIVNYKILEAANGVEAWPIVINRLPDLIVSDLVMPEMDGIQLCSKVKQNYKTSHIPVILLTASLTHELELQGFQAGADAYITKPFSFEILESRIRNLVARREIMKKQFQKNFRIEPGSIGITSLDEKLMTKALKIVEENITDSELSVESLSNELGFSRVHLYKKMTSITGKTPVEFIRLVRLKRAAQLLRESQLTVSEIAYQVGFSDPRYFSKIFKAEFKELPTQYKANHNSKPQN